MVVEYNIVKQLSNNKILIEENFNSKSKNNRPRYYMLDEKYADRFIKSKKQADLLTSDQSLLSFLLAVSIGLLAGMTSKTNKLKNTIFGFGAGILTYIGGEYFDKWLKKSTEKKILQRFDVKEVV